MRSASSGVDAGSPAGVGMPKRRNNCLAWNSWMFTGASSRGSACINPAGLEARRTNERHGLLNRPRAPHSTCGRTTMQVTRRYSGMGAKLQSTRMSGRYDSLQAKFFVDRVESFFKGALAHYCLQAITYVGHR